MSCSLKYGIALALVFLSTAVSNAAQITVLARDLNNNPITGVTLRVKVFDAANRNNPVEIGAQKQLFANTNGTLLVNVNGFANVQLEIDDNGAGLLDVAVLNGLLNIPQQVVIVMPEASPPPAIVCRPVVQGRSHHRCCGLLGRFRR